MVVAPESTRRLTDDYNTFTGCVLQAGITGDFESIRTEQYRRASAQYTRTSTSALELIRIGLGWMKGNTSEAYIKHIREKSGTSYLFARTQEFESGQNRVG